MKNECPSCGKIGLAVFYEARQVPVHSVLLFSTKKEAVEYPTGDIALGFCENCGFISNLAFDPHVHEYSARYEETQGFSSTFSAFQRSLAQRLIDEYDLHKKTVIEIGCGKGEFLSLLCELGENTGIGFDPAYIPARNLSPVKDRMTFIQDFYGEKYSNYQADFVCCKMTLEHISDVGEFMKTVRRSIGNRRDTIVFFQIPEVRRILREQAFWDMYYEHCSYFSQGSLARLFRKSGFDVMDLGTEYDDQYLMIEGRPGTGRSSPPLEQENDLDALTADVATFTQLLQPTLEKWNRRMEEIRQTGRRAVIWGGGSKGVAFLTKLGITDQIPYAVDINPYKHGTFMAGTGQEIVGPEFLKRFRPNLVIIMNPIYREEIKSDLQKLGLAPDILAITE